MRLRRAAPPAVSIVVATLDRAAWLRGAIDSVLAQDHRDLELVVVDDGSSDATPEVLEGYGRRHPRERFRFVRQANSGQAKALNLGYEVARGELLGYLSDDDLLAPGAVSRLVAAIGGQPEAVGAYPAYRVVDAEGAIEDTIVPIEYTPAEALRLHDTIVGPGALVRRSALESAGGWDPSLSWVGDLLLWMKVGIQGRMLRVPEPLASWRRHAGARTSRFLPEHSREHLQVIQRAGSLPGLPPQPLAARAEALRNACVFAAFFGGPSQSWPSERFSVIDIHRPRVSAATAGADPRQPSGEVGAEVSRLWRELLRPWLERASARGHGFDTAMDRLRSVGALPGATPSPGVGEAELRTAVLEAALDCGADADAGSTRFFVIDRASTALSGERYDELMGLAFRTSASGLREALARNASQRAAPH